MGEGPFDKTESDYQVEDDVRPDDLESMQTAIAGGEAGAFDLGPCLYLGPSGERCYKRATNGGFCAAHQPGATARAKIAKRSKVMAAIAGLLGALWPYIYDFVRELLRLFHPR
jgi:hypothetical protein